jgi:peptide/nickel transport system substrate-binding protein
MSVGITRRNLLGAAAVAPAFAARSAAAASNTLTVAIPNSPATLDPINTVIHDPMVLTGSIFEALVLYDQDGVLRPQLAKALPEISADKLTYTFELRDDVLFHNGQQMTSADVKYSFESMLDPKRNAVRRPLFTRIQKVDTDGPYRVHFTLSEPYSPWIYFLTKHMGIWPKDSRETLGDDHFKLHPTGVGTGPGMFEEWRPNESVTLVRNPHYWDKGLPHWEKLVVRIVPEDATRVAYLLTRQVDIIGAPPPRDFERLSHQKGLVGGARPTLGGWTVMFTNNAKPPFDDANFRRAMAYALDRDTIAQKAFYNLVAPCTVPAPPGSWWYDEAADHVIRYDPDKARAFLKASKYPDGAEFDMTLPATPYLLDMKDAAVVIQSQLEAIGIKPRLKLGEPMVIIPQAMRGEHECLLLNNLSPGEPTYLLTQNLVPNMFMSKVSSYANPRVDQLLHIAYGENDQAKLKPVFAELMTVLAQDSPYIWLGFFESANLWRDSVKDFKVNQGVSMMLRETIPG